ncbi:MAG: Methionine--tRNA ligase [bacterium]|nr:Methionine--tRNA ligase [bacterium]
MTPPVFGITTPLYYTNGRPHIGHTYSTCIADTLARYYRQCGSEVWFITGADEHGQKIANTAKKHDKTPQAWCDDIVTYTKELWDIFGMSYDRYVRTTEPAHYLDVQEVVDRLQERGAIYSGSYEGWYSVSEERFVPESEKEQVEADNGTADLVWTSEETFYFRMSAYRQALLDLYAKEPERIRPESRRNEILSRLQGEELKDLSITRTSIEWGVPLDSLAPGHVCYVWVDALLGYATASSYRVDPARFGHLWPNIVHLIGKDILWFHTVIMPAVLLAAELPLTRGVVAHGFWVKDDQKISKSRGNLIQPEPFIEEFGPDPFRYYLLREASLGSDGTFSDEAFIHRVNSDLANDLGNALHRSLSMLGRYRQGTVPARPETPPDPAYSDLQELIARVLPSSDAELEEFRLQSALEQVWEVVRGINKFIDSRAPWALSKQGNDAALDQTLYDMLDALRLIAIALSPYIPNLAQAIWSQLGLDGLAAEQPRQAAHTLGLLPAGTLTRLGEPIVPRIDEAAYFERLAAGSAPAAPPANAIATPAPPVKKKGGDKGEIQYDDFGKLDLRVAEVTAAERVEGADKLLKLTVSLGTEERTIVSGIAEHYTPESMVGRKIVVLVNLAPRKLRGVESQGMLLAATTADGRVIVLSPEQDAAAGSPVS